MLEVTSIKKGAILKRCAWCENAFEAYEKYHDTEWGVPVHEDRKHYEFLILEGAQAGLSWSTVLKKRAGYQQAFANFNPQVVAQFSQEEQEQLLENPQIIRNRLKVKSAVENAKAFLKLQKEFGSFNQYIWTFVNHQPIVNTWSRPEDVPVRTEISDAMSKDLKKRGFTFVGSTIMYAYMQACGLVNDHTTDCFRYRQVLKLNT